MNPAGQRHGAWIFVSHSHRDLEKVRRVRNELERRGHNSRLFFLKCLEDDDARLPELIRNLKTSEMEWHGCWIFRRYHTLHLVNPGAYPAGMN